MHEQFLLVVGASARAAAFSAHRAGFRPLAIDLFADADLANLCRVERWDYRSATLLQIASRLPPCAWLYTGGLENHPHMIESLAAERPLYGNCHQGLAAVRDPWQLATTLGRHGFRTPDLSGSIRCPPHGRWIRKRFQSAGGLQIEFLNPNQRCSASDRSAYLQQFIPGPSLAATYVSSGNRTELLGITQQMIGLPWTGADGFRYSGSIGPVAAAPSMHTQFHRLGVVVAQEFALQGLFGVDTVCNDEGIWTIEVNPRYTASVEVLERAHRFSAIRQHVAVFQRRAVPNLRSTSESQSESSESHAWTASLNDGAGPVAESRVHNRACFGKAIVYARCRVEVNEAFGRLVGTGGDEPKWPQYADIPAGGTVIEKGRPVTTVFTEARNAQLVEAGLQQRVRAVQEVLGC